MASFMKSSDERLAQLRAFDESKAGVKGLVDAGISTLPPIFIHPLSPSLSLPKPDNGVVNSSIPIIDLKRVLENEDPYARKYVVEKVGDAARKWGFFQVVNHGIGDGDLEEMVEGIRRFFEQDVEVKKSYYSRDSSKAVIYNSNFDLYTGPATNWRDSFACRFAPHPPRLHDLPAAFREIIMAYSKQVMRLGSFLLELLSEALGLHPNHLKEIGCCEGLILFSHYYPACPQPELAMGTSPHSDSNFITILLQDHVGGLQILHDGHWVDIPPLPGALVVNIGDLLQLVSNDKFRSAEHRVPANSKGLKGQGFQWHPFLGMLSIRIPGCMNPSRSYYQKIILPSIVEPQLKTTVLIIIAKDWMEILLSSISGSSYYVNIINLSVVL